MSDGILRHATLSAGAGYGWTKRNRTRQHKKQRTLAGQNGDRIFYSWRKLHIPFHRTQRMVGRPLHFLGLELDLGGITGPMAANNALTCSS